MLFDKIVLVEQRTETGSYGNLNWVAIPGLESVPMNIQPYSPTLINMDNGLFFKTYKAFTTASGIVEDMRLTVSGTNEQFIVRGRQRFDYIVLPHYELIVESATQ